MGHVGLGRRPAGGERETLGISTGISDPGRCGALDLLRHLKWGLACWLAAAAIAPPTALARSPFGPSGPADDEARKPGAQQPPSYFVILNAPVDLDALLQKIQHPDLEVRRVDRPRPTADLAGAPAEGESSAPAVVEAVRIRGRVRGDSAALKVELVIVTAGDGPTWVPIRLEGQRLIDAREGARILDLKMAEAGRWQVELTGRGSHRVEVELRSPLTINPARASLSLAIPAAPLTSLDLDFDRREPDLIVGANEVYGQAELPAGAGWRLSAHLEPRSRVDVSWAIDAASGGGNPPLLTAQGDIAIDIDLEQMRTRSSWVIRCVRGMTRTLEVQVHEPDEVTELRIDDQQAEAPTPGGRGAGPLIIPLAEPLRPGAERRLVIKTRRPYARGTGGRLAFGGFPIVHAREQSGAIGVTQGADLWVAPASSRNLRRILPTQLPQELRERPATSLAFLFLDQPFELNLEVEPSPPLVRSRSRTLFRIEGDRARSGATIDLHWVRGRLFDLELGLGPGLEVASVGPPSVVEAWNLTGGTPARGPAGGGAGPHGLTIRLAPPVRDQSKVTLQLEGFQRLPKGGPVSLGLFTPDETTAVSASFSVVGDRSLSVELDEEAMRSDRAGGAAFRVRDVPAERPPSSSDGDPGGQALVVDAVGSPRTLPIRITRHARSLREETVVSAEVSRRSVEFLQKTTFTVRHGTLDALRIRVPTALAGRWELLDREGVDRREPVRESDGSMSYRLIFERPVSDRATLRFRWQRPIDPPLDASGDREVDVPWIAFPDAAPAPARVELTPASGVVFRGGDPAWTGPTAGGQPESGSESAAIAYLERTADRHQSFRFRARALEPVVLPGLMVPRLLIRSTLDLDDATRYRAWYWVEAHGPAFPFALPEGARIIAARVGGRVVDRVDFEPKRGAYRLAFPADAASRPALVELEYHLAGAGSRWQPPRLLDGGVVLQTVWEARLPWDRALLGVPRGWSDENDWFWGGNLWIRRSSRDGAALNRWLVGGGAPAAVADDLRESTPDDAHPLVFSRTGEPADLEVWIASRAWLVAACSGVTLLLGFLAIFSRLRFRTAWAIAAGLALLAAAMLPPSVTAQLMQSALVGAALTLLGLLIQHRLDRRRSPARSGREPASGLGPSPADSSLKRAPAVGSDDPTAIRVRTPSTLDYVPTPLMGPADAEGSRSSTLGRA
jgi:hypothetical protein